MFKNRITRLSLRSSIVLNDFRRAFVWHARGRKYYQDNWQEIAAKYKWCFIVGCNNSGTTLMQDVLEQTLPVSTLLHEGQRYTNALQRGSRRSYERVWTEFIADLQMSEHDSLSCAPRLLHDWMNEYGAPKEKTLVEKTTVNAVRMRWLQHVFPNSYFIGVVRNGYAVAEGINRKGKKDYVRGARHWENVNKIMLDDSKSINNFIIMKYEDLTENPYLSIQKLTRFLNFDDAISSRTEKLDNAFKDIKNMNSESIRRININDRKRIRENALQMLSHFNYEI